MSPAGRLELIERLLEGVDIYGAFVKITPEEARRLLGVKEPPVSSEFFKPEDFADLLSERTLAASMANAMLKERGMAVYIAKYDETTGTIVAHSHKINNFNYTHRARIHAIEPIPIAKPDSWEKFTDDIINGVETRLELYERAKKLLGK